MSLILDLLNTDDSPFNTDDFLRRVAALLPTRTVQRGTAGKLAGTFNDLTVPTGDQVLLLKDDAAAEIDVDLGDIDKLPDTVSGYAYSLLRLRTAMLVELTYFAEQVATGRSAYDKYADMYKARLAAMIKAVAEIGGGSDLGPADDVLSPVYSFPPAPCDDEHIPSSERPFTGGWWR